MSMAQLVGSYNTQKSTHERQVVQAKMARIANAKALEARRVEIDELVRRTFWATDRHNKRSGQTMAKAYATGEVVARQGGEEYSSLVSIVRFARTSPENYADACAALLISVND